MPPEPLDAGNSGSHGLRDCGVLSCRLEAPLLCEEKGEVGGEFGSNSVLGVCQSVQELAGAVLALTRTGRLEACGLSGAASAPKGQKDALCRALESTDQG
mmetsp:Transcript_67902/g.106824  ORF Transcript_67902/g.106824 Transcript_67902/m.106824 type:complete len:100 (-) Transcript_67902:135-434(-)